MENSAMRFRGRLLAAVLLSGVVAAPAVLAQEELSVDPKALDSTGAASKPKAKKPKQAAAPGATAALRAAVAPGRAGGASSSMPASGARNIARNSSAATSSRCTVAIPARSDATSVSSRETLERSASA